MKLAMYDAGAGPRVGVVNDGRVTDAGWAGSMIALISEWDRRRPEVEARLQDAPAIPLAAVRLLPPVARPGKIFPVLPVSPWRTKRMVVG